MTPPAFLRIRGAAGSNAAVASRVGSPAGHVRWDFGADINTPAAAGPQRAPLALAGALACACALLTGAAPPANDYPTAARVEYVQECMGRGHGGLADLYKCSCVIDALAQHLTYEEYVEAATFAHYATLGGQGGGIFRDTSRARERAKLYLSLEAEAWRSCGLEP